METIRSSREIDRVFSDGKRHRGSLVLIISAPAAPERDPQGRVAFIAGKKLGGAVVRNRAKRILRQAAREAGAPWQGHDVLLVARAPVLERPYPDVVDAIKKGTRGLGDGRRPCTP